MTTHTKCAVRCPACGRPNDVHSSPGRARPKAGDIGICFGCHAILVFEADGSQRLSTDEERREALADPRARAALRALVSGGGWGAALDAIDRQEKVS